MDSIDASTMDFIHSNHSELHNFIDEANFNQFITSIRGEENVANQDFNFGADLTGGSMVDGNYQFIDPSLEVILGSNDRVLSHITDFTFNAFPEFGEDMNHGEEDNDGEDSSATTTPTTTITTPNKRGRVDRSRTLISERRRRGRMKEKLYALRSLVPNITKMDKASIVGDAVLYVQELQMQAKKLKADIAALEASLAGSERNNHDHNQSLRRTQILNNNHPISRKIFQVDVFQVEERGFYVRLVSNKDVGVAVLLYRALESLKSFSIQSSNLATASDKFIFTFTLNVKGYEHGVNLPNLKLWITGALLNQGFELMNPTFA